MYALRSIRSRPADRLPVKSVHTLAILAVIAFAASAAWGQPCVPDWAEPPPGIYYSSNRVVFSLAIVENGPSPGTSLYAGGLFESAGSTSAKNIARWNGVTWFALGGGLDGEVNTIEVFDDRSGAGPLLYAGGEFDTAGGVSASKIARWDGASWTPLGLGIGSGGVVRDMIVFDDGADAGPALYVGGSFASAGGMSIYNVGRWNGATWQSTGAEFSISVWDLVLFDLGDGPALYAAGDLGAGFGGRVIRFEGNTWLSIANTPGGWPMALAAWNGGEGGPPELYVGGNFTEIGGLSSRESGIAKWNGNTWSLLGAGLGRPVYTLALFADGTGFKPTLYAGGQFEISVPNNDGIRNIAKWDGEIWSNLGAGVQGPVEAFAIGESAIGATPQLYIGGAFLRAGPFGAYNLAMWEGCPVRGACCLSTDDCVQVSRPECAVIPGETSWNGPYTSCAWIDGRPRCPLGACCLRDGTCVDGLSGYECSLRDSVRHEPVISCEAADCPQPLGACCLAGGGCVELLATDCGQFAGSAWAGPLTTCANQNGQAICPLGACCLRDGSCDDGMLQATCESQGGTFRGNASACAGVSCPQPSGACCLANGTCIILTRANCAGSQNSRWAGPETTCVNVAGTFRCPLGACCLPDGSCQDDLVESQCVGLGGTHRGTNTSCSTANCPQPTGACCLSTATCRLLSEQDCALFGNSRWAGPDTVCLGDDTPTCPLGVCCLQDGSCVGSILEQDCAGQGGNFQADVASCDEVNCPLPSGACCLSNGTCLDLPEDDCILFEDSTWIGPNTACADVQGAPTCPLGACCRDDGTCAEGMTQADCQAVSGIFRGPGSTCTNCPQPLGACCLPNGNCIALRRTDCELAPDAVWAGPNTTCSDSNGDGRPDACDAPRGDVNGDGTLGPGDIPPFIAVLLGSPQAPEHVALADVNGDGIVDGRDIAQFITAIMGTP